MEIPDGIVSSIPEWGIAGAIIVVVLFFLWYMERKDRMFAESLELHDERFQVIIDKFSANLDRNSDAIKQLAIQCAVAQDGRRDRNK